ncbi:hypothetical protein [Desulforamulus hydrothermalis]|uniref:Uncharacterized protein n=1 Tax=Desulforamulus hydrothermalis Lam5 = DSM 18033 TaxID=1121428 RepID=K8DXE5_9FIRM|nr:hypothetical protein [Desulforamulus hydrothermalis]CCO07239.1 conserved hypothetical protein [Desulforamulus hydrothermalis Lam5 = DSM 18033]SHG87348.1 hypothetical protein SAMN02745177_00635 [Desulforamulus hydrothermalis Lam5 = DSM 18033]
MGTQQLVNGQMIITSIAKYSITKEESLNLPKFEPCIDAYDQLIYLVADTPPEINPAYDCYGQLVNFY